MSLLLVYQVVMLSLIGVMAGVLAVNVVTVRSLRWYKKQEFKGEQRNSPFLLRQGGRGVRLGWPEVAVCVPARNEALNIERCVRSLLAQDYAGTLRVLVLDDDSDDGTGEIVAGLAANDARLTLMPGAPLPSGWLGKNWACHQLSAGALAVGGASEQVAGYLSHNTLTDDTLLLFTDADTWHAPDALTAAVSALRHEKVGLLSVFPRQITQTFAERMSVPLTFFYVFALLPNFMVRRSHSPAYSAANGQFMLYTRAAYQAIGGHAAFRAIVLEDVRMAQAVKRAGLPTLLPDGSDVIQTRMYRSAGEVWRGFSKNVYAFFDNRLVPCLIFLVLNMAMYVVPYFFVVGTILTDFYTPEKFWLPVAQIMLSILIRGGIAQRFNLRVADALLHAVSMLYLLAIALNSVHWQHSAQATWKGRSIAANKRLEESKSTH